MFDIVKIHPIINHLKSISNYYKETSKEIIIYCAYCDDATRVKADHGHLYISQSAPVFNCFRCSSSGNLVRLLIDTGFNDEEILNYLSQFIKYKTTKDYYRTKKKVAKLKQIQENIIKKNLEFESKFPDKFEIYKNYLYSRLGVVDFSNFLISPTFFNNNLSCMFTNSDNEDVVLRLINPTSEFKHHLNTESSGRYYFQERNFENISKVVLAEGQFDILNLYLYSSAFKNSYFISLSGKKYSSAIEALILEDFLIGDLEINMIFDSDVKNYNTYIYRARLLAKQYNTNITIKGYLPLVGKDTGYYPAVIDV